MIFALTMVAACLVGQAPEDEPKEAPAKAKPSAKAKGKAKEAPFVGIAIKEWKYSPPVSPGLLYGVISMDCTNTGHRINAGQFQVTTRDRRGKMLETGTGNILDLGPREQVVLRAQVKHHPDAVAATFTASELTDNGIVAVPIRVIPPARGRR